MKDKTYAQKVLETWDRKCIKINCHGLAKVGSDYCKKCIEEDIEVMEDLNEYRK